MKKIQTKRENYYVILDEDIHWKYSSLKISFQESKPGYIQAKVLLHDWKTKKKKYFLLHRLVMNEHRNNFVVDHINGDPRDNRLDNLRIATYSQNSKNKKKNYETKLSKFKGVDKVNSKYRAQVKKDGKSLHLGVFSTEIEAALAYDVASIFDYGAFANTNLLGKHGHKN